MSFKDFSSLSSFSPSQLKSLHLFRALLRETTYLPDEAARSFFHRRIVARFKAYQPKPEGEPFRKAKNNPRSFRRRPLAIVNERTRPKQRKAQKGLNYLRRANQGEQRCLEKILYMTYGRLGPRRYDLLQNLLRPEESLESAIINGHQLAPLQEHYHSKMRLLEVFDAPKKISDTEQTIAISDRYAKLKAVLTSQVRHGIAIGRAMKRAVLTTPIHNVWERPMPVRRARNDVRRWYADAMARLLPPLPAEEWDRLQALAAGDAKCERVARRTPAKPLHPEPEDPVAETREDIEQALALNRPSKADRPAGTSRPHRLTARSMRRLYAKTLNYCCKVGWDETRSKWVVEWPNMQHITPRVYAAPVDDELFAGVDAKGMLPKAKAAKKTAAKPAPFDA